MEELTRLLLSMKTKELESAYNLVKTHYVAKLEADAKALHAQAVSVKAEEIKVDVGVKRRNRSDAKFIGYFIIDCASLYLPFFHYVPLKLNTK